MPEFGLLNEDGSMAEISDRKKKILAAVVDEYIASAEPVGSKRIVEKSSLNVSSATIRNELAELTSLGYLEQPHTSAGRVPTALGYRFYVNELMEKQRLTMEETEEINRTLNLKAQRLDQMMDDLGKLAADVTNYPALALTAQAAETIRRFELIYVDANTFIVVLLLSGSKVKNKLVHLPFSVEEVQIRKLCTVFNANFCGLTEQEITPALIAAAERAADDHLGLTAAVAGFAISILSESAGAKAVVAGGSKLLRLPEFQDPDKAHSLMDFLSDAENLRELPGAGFTEASTAAGGDENNDVKVLIGPENVAEELKDSSVILAKYDAGDGMQGVIGVVGPTRMDYSKIAAKLSYIAEGIGKALASSKDSALPGFGKLMIVGKHELTEEGHYGGKEKEHS